MPVKVSYANPAGGVRPGTGSPASFGESWLADPDIAAQGRENQSLAQMQANLAAQREAEDNEWRLRLAAQEAEARSKYGAEEGARNLTLQGGELGSRERIAGLQAQNALDVSRLPIDWARERFGQVFPTIQGELTNIRNQLGQQPGPGGLANSPEITVGPVWNNQQQQQAVNASRAYTDQATQARTRTMQRNLGGQGLGSNSPMASALQMGYQNQGLNTNVSNEREIKTGMAGQNAQHVLGTQQARENQFATRQDEDIRRRQPLWGSYNALLAQLGGLA